MLIYVTEVTYEHGRYGLIPHASVAAAKIIDNLAELNVENHSEIKRVKHINGVVISNAPDGTRRIIQAGGYSPRGGLFNDVY